MRLPASEIEAAVVVGLRSFLADHRGLLFRLGAENPSEAPVALRSLSTLLQALGGRIDSELESSIRLMLSRVVVGHNRLQLVFPDAGLRSVLAIPRGGSVWPANAPEADQEFILTVPFTAARRGRQMKLVLPNASSEAAVDRSLVTAIVRA